MNLAGFSSLGAVGSVAGVVASASGVGAQLCPPAPGGEAVTSCAATAVPAGVVSPPAASAAVPGLSGCQQRQEVSRSSRRRCRSSSDGTSRAMKKCPRGCSPSLVVLLAAGRSLIGPSPESSEDDRAEASPPRSGRALGGTPGDSRPAPAGDRLPRPGPSSWTSLLSAGAERYRAGFGGYRSPSPSGVADNDHSSAFDAVDIDRDDSFPVCSGPHPELPQHGRAGKTSLCIDLWVDAGDFSSIPPAHLSLNAVASGRH